MWREGKGLLQPLQPLGKVSVVVGEGSEAQGNEWDCPGSHRPPGAEAKARTIVFGKLGYHFYINIMH